MPKPTFSPLEFREDDLVGIFGEFGYSSDDSASGEGGAFSGCGDGLF